MFAGMVAEYATSRNWGKAKLFLISSTGFFFLFLLYTIIFPSEKGIFVGTLIGAGLGITLGLTLVILIHLKSNTKNKVSIE